MSPCISSSSLHISSHREGKCSSQDPTGHKWYLGRPPKPGSSQLWAPVHCLPSSHQLNRMKVWYSTQLKSRGAWSLLTPSGVTQNSPLSSPGHPEPQRRLSRGEGRGVKGEERRERGEGQIACHQCGEVRHLRSGPEPRPSHLKDSQLDCFS